MKIKEEEALKLWNERYGKGKQKQEDFCGRIMYKTLFGRTNHDNGWNCDHIMPKSKGGTNKKCNIELANHISNSEKGNKTSFIANGKHFEVRTSKEKGCYKIVHKNKVKKTAKQKLFFKHIINGLDFAGRKVDIKDTHCYSESTYSDNIKSKYIAHIDTIKEHNQKTKFTANGNNFVLKKIDESYKFINTSRITDKLDVDNVEAVIKEIYNTYNQETYKDVLYIQGINTSELIYIVKKINEHYNLDIDIVTYTNNDEVSLIIDTPCNKDTCRVHDFAIYLNSLRYILNNLDNQYSISHSTHSFAKCEIDTFIKDVKNKNNIVYERYKQNRIILSSNVMNLLLKCNYKKDSFTLIRNGIYARNYEYTVFSK